MPQYLQDDETLSDRVDYLLDRVRRSPVTEERERYVAELRALESAAAVVGNAFTREDDFPISATNILRGDERGLNPQDDVGQETIDYLTGVLDASYGGEAPVAVKANFLFHLTGEGEAVELTGSEFEVQADDPEDKLPWSDLGATPTPEPHPLAGPVGPTDSEGFDLDEDDEPTPISAAERLRQKTAKKKGK